MTIPGRILRLDLDFTIIVVVDLSWSCRNFTVLVTVVVGVRRVLGGRLVAACGGFWGWLFGFLWGFGRWICV